MTAYLTVSGQLHAEIFACSMSNVYTFGPTFRAEKSQSRHHLSEFWMLEPEMAFCHFEEMLSTVHQLLVHTTKSVIDECAEDINFFAERVDKTVFDRLDTVASSKQPFQTVTYTEAIKILEKSKQQFEFPVKWGVDLQKEHERFLCEVYFKVSLFPLFQFSRTFSSLSPFFFKLSLFWNKGEACVRNSLSKVT